MEAHNINRKTNRSLAQALFQFGVLFFTDGNQSAYAGGRSILNFLYVVGMSGKKWGCGEFGLVEVFLRDC